MAPLGMWATPFPHGTEHGPAMTTKMPGIGFFVLPRCYPEPDLFPG